MTPQPGKKTLIYGADWGIIQSSPCVIPHEPGNLGADDVPLIVST
jgi:hypothetical protein